MTDPRWTPGTDMPPDHDVNADAGLGCTLAFILFALACAVCLLALFLMYF